MGVISGSVSYALYHVPGELPAGFREEAFDKIARFWFRPLHPQGDEDISVGWCGLADILQEEARPEAVFSDGYLTLGLRVDKWAIPATLLKARVKKAEQQRLEETRRQRLNKSEREALKEEMVRVLKQQSLPSVSVTDAVWSLDQGLVRFWSTSARANERFADLFFKTFEIRLVPDMAYTAAVQCGLEGEQVALLADVEAARFTASDGLAPF